MDAKSRIAWIGAGRMGVPMAGFLLRAGHPLTVYSPSASSRAKLVERGGVEALSVADCVANADVVFTCVADDRALRAVADDVLAHAMAGAIFVDASTVSAGLSAAIAAEAEARDLPFLRAPISGNAVSAQRGDVAVLASGPRTAFDTVRPLLATFSTAQVYLGPAEEARIMKLVVNAMVVNLAQSMAESLTLGRKAGLDWTLMLDTLAQTTIASPWLKAKAGLLAKRDFTTSMSVQLILKDIDLMLDLARDNGVPMPLTAVTRQLMQVLAGEGHAQEDYMVLVKLAEQQSGMTGDPS